MGPWRAPAPRVARYKIALDVKHGPLERFDALAIASSCKERWANWTLARVNESVLRLGVLRGEFHWHRHRRDDELFFVLKGRLFVELERKTIELGPGQGVVVPRGARHRTRAPRRTVVLMVETMGIRPTGD